MFGGLFKEKVGGDIAYFGLTDWWLSAFSREERNHIIATYKPFGSAPDFSIAFGEIQYSSGNQLSFLTVLAGWFDNPRDRALAYRIITKAKDYKEGADVLDLHFFYSEKMKLYYKDRENPQSLQTAIESARSQINLANEVAEQFRKKFKMADLPRHEGYDQLCVILSKQGKYKEAIALASQAKSEGWNSNWDAIIERNQTRLDRA